MDDMDISWLTQVPRNDNMDNNVLDTNVESDGDGWFDFNVDNAVSLEEPNEPVGGQILYDSVVWEDISSDEELDKM